MVKRKVSLSSPGGAVSPGAAAAAPGDVEVLELFFNAGVVHHEVELPAALPDTVSGFVVMKDHAGRDGFGVRRAQPGEEPDVEIAPLEHVAELSRRWLPVPYQLSCPLAVQIYLATDASGSRLRALLAIDTLEVAGASGRCLDAALDEGRPFRALDKTESGSILARGEVQDLVRKLEAAGVERAPFKLLALLDTLAPFLPRIRFSRIEPHAAIPVSLVLDFGNSRSSAALVEPRDDGLFALPLELRNSSDPLSVSDETFDSRITFLPSAFDGAAAAVAVGDGFTLPSIARLGREALDRALETPHRYACSLSGPKRYLWEDRPNADRWHFAQKQGGEFVPVSGRILKYLPDDGDGLALRADGPSAPSDPRYAPRAMMLFALVEILSQAMSQVAGARYRKFQGKEHRPRVLRHVVLTFPSGMPDEEKRVYERIAQNATVLACGLLHVPEERRPNWSNGAFEPFLFVDEALAAQMVFVYQEVAHVFGGSMEAFAGVYGGKDGAVRVASIDIGGGTSDVMIAEYRDRVPGSGTALAIKKLFQDGVSIAGDEVCRAIVEDVVFAQLLQQLGSPQAREKLVHLFGEGDAGHGSAWRTLKAKLVPYFWMPLARCYWAIAEGFTIPDHAPDKLYAIGDLVRLFEGATWSPAVLAEADRFLAAHVEGFPGLANLSFRFDRAEVEQAIAGVLREPLRRYAHVVAQFDVDLLVLAGRASALPCVRDLFLAEMPVAPPRIMSMSRYRVAEWYPSKWQESGRIKDPKSTVAAGATVLHLASKNRIAGFSIDAVESETPPPIYGLYQAGEPHIARQNELFRKGRTSPPFSYTSGMLIGFRNVDAQEMDGSPLFEVRPASDEVKQALLEDRVRIRFELDAGGRVRIASAESDKDLNEYAPEDFVLRLKTATLDRYWLDTGELRGIGRYA
ncbi:MAG TPA: virulence factor SrfB [Minicystis sp.]|nr:virulence factor SrfB [Minicystis sp.]